MFGDFFISFPIWLSGAAMGRPIEDVSVTPDGQYVVAGSKNKEVYFLSR